MFEMRCLFQGTSFWASHGIQMNFQGDVIMPYNAFFNGHVFPFFLEPSRLGSRAQKKKSLFGTVGYVTGLTSFFWCCSCQLCDGFQHVCVGSRSLDEPETRLPELCSKLVVLIEIEVC